MHFLPSGLVEQTDKIAYVLVAYAHSRISITPGGLLTTFPLQDAEQILM